MFKMELECVDTGLKVKTTVNILGRTFGRGKDMKEKLPKEGITTGTPIKREVEL